MRTRRLGDSDLQVSALGLGCWPLGGGAGWGDIDEAQAIATIHAALDLGITFFDTAEGYNAGRSEEIVGRALCDRRDRAVIATKISPQNCAPAAIRAHCEASLRRLQTDYVDLYQVHWPIREHDVAAAFETLQALQREGKVRQLGISNFGVQDMSALLATGARPISNQLHYSLLSRAIETDIIPLCQAEGLGVICYMALLQGVLADAFASADEVPDFRARTRHFAPTRPSSSHGTPGAEAEVFAAVRRIRELATDLDLPMAVLSLAWVAAKPSVGCVLIGSRRPDQLARNLPAGDLPLSAEVVATLDAITEPVRQKLGPNPDYWLSGERARIR